MRPFSVVWASLRWHSYFGDRMKFNRHCARFIVGSVWPVDVKLRAHNDNTFRSLLGSFVFWFCLGFFMGL